MTEFEKRAVFAQILEAQKALAAIGNKTTDPDILNWVDSTMRAGSDFMVKKCGRSNEYPYKVFKVYKEKKANKNLTNAEIAQKIGVPESTVRAILEK